MSERSPLEGLSLASGGKNWKTREVPVDKMKVKDNQWLFLVPLKGGIGSMFHPPEGKDYKWYILPIGGLYATYHLLGEPETTIEIRLLKM